MIDRFRIPPFLLPIYQAAGSQYGIRWEVLAAINEIETDYGRNLNVSSAGALGWMQFMPSSWTAYGVDANEDGVKDPYNPVDAIFASARYLKAAGGDKDLRQAIFAYNHADWYVDSVLMRARLVAGMPADLVGSLTGLTQGHFPVYATAHYEGNLSPREARRLNRRTNESHNAAKIVGESSNRRSINIYAREGAPVIAVNDGTVKEVGTDKRRGNFLVLQDIYGNRFTYTHLAKLSKTHPVPRSLGDTSARDEFHAARSDKSSGEGEAQVAPAKLNKPTVAATAGRPSKPAKVGERSAYRPANAEGAASSETGKERLFANPARVGNLAADAGQSIDGSAEEEFKVYFSDVLKLSPKEMKLKPLKKGSKLIAGTVIGRIGAIEGDTGANAEPHLNFSIQPAGRKAPRIDPKPILDGWKLLGGDRPLPRGRQEPLHRPRVGPSQPGPGTADVQGSAPAAGAERPLRQHLRLRPQRHPHRRGRQTSARSARVPGGLRPPPHRHLAQLRPQLPDRGRRRLRPPVRTRGRHRRDQRHPDLRPPGPGHDHRDDDPQADDAPGHVPPVPDHLADGPRRPELPALRPLRPHPRRLPVAGWHAQREAGHAGPRRAVGQPVGQVRLAADEHRQPGRADHPVEVLGSRSSRRKSATDGLATAAKSQ